MEVNMARPADISMRVSSRGTGPRRPIGDLTIIINRPYADLESELKQVFEGIEKVKMFVDRRYEERRTRGQSRDEEYRKAERRKVKQGLVEAIISL
jgi:hypothetical protein